MPKNNILEPFVSIVCMTYNHGDYIRKTIDSFRAQDYNNVEFIIVDDCSKDSTYSIALEAGAGDDRIKVYKNTSNLGSLVNSKYSLSLANGEFIGFCEGDDFFINENRLSLQVKYLIDNPHVSMVFTGSIDVDHNDNQISHNGYGAFHKSFSLSSAVKIGGNLCSTSATLYRRNVTDSLPQEFFTFPVGDYPLQVIAASTGPVVYLPIIGSAYRRFSRNSWSREMIGCDKYLSNHLGTIEMLDFLYIYCGKRHRSSFLYAKLKYMYFLSLNQNVPLHKKLKCLKDSSPLGPLFLFIYIFSPFFRFANAVRRNIIKFRSK